MRLSLFHEFAHPEVLEAFLALCDNVKIDLPKSPSFSDERKASETSIYIFRTNAKLFYEKHEEKEVDGVLEKLKSVGFKVTDRTPSTEYVAKKKILVPDEKFPEPEQRFRACECGKSQIDCTPPRKMKEEIVKEKRLRYFNDRVILKMEV